MARERSLHHTCSKGARHDDEIGRYPTVAAERRFGVGLGDRNDGSPARQAEFQAAFQAAGGRRLAPFKTARYDPDPRRSNWLLRMRRRIEHSIGQLVERFRCRRLRVKDLGHLEHRLVRKIHLSTPLTDGRAGRNPLEIGQPI
jgi:hypothetical protein